VVGAYGVDRTRTLIDGALGRNAEQPQRWTAAMPA
jgi:hypothetical protein